MTRSFVLVLALLLPVGSASALGTDAMIYRAPSAITYTYGQLEATLREAGAPNVDLEFDWPAGRDLGSRYRLVVVTPMESPPDSAYIADLMAFAAEGGGIVLMAEHDRAAEQVNEVAMALGISARFDFADTGGGCAQADAALDHPLTTDAPTVEFAWSRITTGGTPLYGPPAVVTLDGTVVLVGDSDLFADAGGLGSCPVGPSTVQFYRNLYMSLADDSVTMDAGSSADAGVSLDSGLGSDGGALGSVGDPCTANDQCIDGLCAELAGDRFCTRTCTPGSCPMSYECDEGASVCRPSGGGGGGCSAGGVPAAFGAFCVLVFLRRR